MSKLTNLNLIAPINTVSYGIVSLNILKEMSKLVDVSLWPISQPQVTTQEDWDYVQRGAENARSYDPKAPCIRIWHQFDLAQFVGKGTHIGFPIFELDNFTKIEKHNLNSVDRIFVCSQWAKDVIRDVLGEERALVTNVIPLGVDSTVFPPTQPRTSDDKYIFLNIGKWEVRKGHDILPEAFELAFSPDDNVELWLMTENVFLSKEEDQAWKKKYIDTKMFKAGKIKFIPRVNTHHEVYKIMASVDCGVFPSRAEGWNLEALEMLSIGKPIVITNYSAHTEFCNNENSFLAQIYEKEIAYDDKWFFGQGKWAKINMDSLASSMVRAYKKGKIFNQAGVDTANKFSWKNTAKEIVDVLESI